MNLKQFFYREYYSRDFLVMDGKKNIQKRFNPEKPLNKNDFKRIKNYNAPVFAAANNMIRDFTWTTDDTKLLEIPVAAAGVKTLNIAMETTYPGLLIGTGYNHETNNEGEYKLGFYFDHTTGLPVIPGSSVKGTLRSLFPQFESRHPFKLPNDKTGSLKIEEKQGAKIKYIAGLFGFNLNEDNTLKVHQLELAIFEGIDIEATALNYAKGDNGVEVLSPYKQARFFNAFICEANGSNRIVDADTITPHGLNPLKNPTPLFFLKVLPKVRFRFQLVINDINFLGINNSQILLAFEEILLTIGIGAKTNVGYGQFKPIKEEKLGRPEAEDLAITNVEPINIIEFIEPSSKVKSQLLMHDWTAKVYDIKNGNCIFWLSIDGENIRLRKKLEKLSFVPERGDSVILKFRSAYTGDTTDFIVNKSL